MEPLEKKIIQKILVREMIKDVLGIEKSKKGYYFLFVVVLSFRCLDQYYIAFYLIPSLSYVSFN
jgi:hypothetical protein